MYWSQHVSLTADTCNVAVYIQSTPVFSVHNSACVSCGSRHLVPLALCGSRRSLCTGRTAEDVQPCQSRADCTLPAQGPPVLSQKALSDALPCCHFRLFTLSVSARQGPLLPLERRA